MSRRVLLTGATGFLGMELLARLIEDGETEIVALVRAADHVEAGERMGGVLRRLYDDPPPLDDRLLAVPGDVALPQLGLSAADRYTITGSVTGIVHCAASISFDLPAEEAHRVNTTGTRRLLDLADACHRLSRVVHVSTAYVAGRTAGTFMESELARGQDFRNTYERSKFDAELLVAERAAALPLVVARPSIVVGDSRTGWTPAFNVIYWPLRAFARGLIDALPVDPCGVVDVVGADYVADALLHLLWDPSVDGRVHLVAGDGATSVGELIALACEWLGRPVPPLGGQLPKLDQVSSYMPYFDVATRFDDRRARSLLEPAGVRPLPFADFFDAVVAYAERAKWGKAGSSREAAALARSQGGFARS